MLFWLGIGSKVRGEYFLAKGGVPEANGGKLYIKCLQKYIVFIFPLFALPVKCEVFREERNGSIFEWKKLNVSKFSPELKEIIAQKKKTFRPIWWMWLGLPWLVYIIVGFILGWDL